MRRLLLVLSASLLLYGCGGGGSNPPSSQPISVSLSPSTQTTLDQGQTVAYTATVSNDSSSKGVTWSATGTGCTGSACGGFKNVTATSATYNTPATVTSSTTVSVVATSAADTTKSATAAVVVNPAPSISTTTLTDGMVGTAYSATLSAAGGTGTLSWSLASGSSLPSGLTFASGKISGMPTAAGAATFTVKVTDSAPTPVSVTEQLTLTINPVPLVITSTSLANGTVGVAYSASLTATGGTGADTWTVTSGSSLPAGLTLSGNTIGGTPAAAGQTSFSVTVTDSGTPLQTKTQSLSITIAPAPLVITTSPTLTGGTVGTSYTATLAATGGTGAYIWTLTNGSSLPAGLNLNGNVISGTPTTAGQTTFGVTVVDSGTPQQTQTKSLSVTMSPPALVITTSSPLTPGAAGTAYSELLAASGGTPGYTWSLANSSTLPAGLTLNGATITGTPTVSGTFNFTVQVTDTASVSTQMALSLAISPAATHGTVAQGTAIGGATVILKDSVGNVATTTTAADGSYSLNTTGFVPPYLVQVQVPSGSGGGTLYSVSADGGMSTTINVQPYTDLIVRSYYNSQGLNTDAAFGTGNQVPPSVPNPATVQVLQTQVVGVAQLFLQQAGVNASQLNMISGTFVANGQGLDQVLDETTVDTSSLTLTITAGTTTQTSTISTNANTGSVTVSSTTTSPTGTSSSTSSTVLPTATAQQTALNGIMATVQALGNTLGSKGSQLTLADIAPYLASDFMNDGLTPAQYATQVAAGLAGGIGGQIQTIKSLNTSTADIVFSSGECLFEFVNGTWLFAGDGRIAWLNLLSSAVTNEGASYGPSGPELSLAVEAPQGTVSSITITGGTIWPTPTPLTQNPTIYNSTGVNFDQFHAGSGVLTPATFPAVGTPFTVTVTPVNGQPVSYTLTSSAFTTEQIYITAPTNTSMAGASLGNPLQVSWTLPTTYAVTQLSISTNSFTGSLSNPSTQECMGGNPNLALDATSTSVTFPTTCNGQPVTAAGVTVMAVGSNGETSSAVLQFGNTSGGGGGNAPTIASTSVPNGAVNTPYAAYLLATGGIPPYTWSTTGPFPSCLALNPSTGAITGTPTSSCAGQFNFNAVVTDSTTPTSLTATQPLSITISNPGALAITTDSSLPPGTAGASYSAALNATGGTPPYAWTMANGSSLPSGLGLSGSGITGTPLVSGNFTFTVQVADSTLTSVQQQFSLTLGQATTSGAVAQGAPIAGAALTLEDSAGNSATATTASDGTYSVNTMGFVPPYLVQVQIPNGGGNLYSVSADNGMSTTINVHPYTDLLVRAYYGSQGLTADAAFASPSPSAPNPATVQILQNQITDLAQLWLNKAGVSSSFNMISGTFAANGSGLDQVLNWTMVNTSNLTVTITDQTTTQTSTITFNPSTSTVAITSTTSNNNGTTSTTASAVVPAGSSQQTALSGIMATLTAMLNTSNSQGGQLTAAQVLPYLSPDLLQDGLNQAQYAAALAAGGGDLGGTEGNFGVMSSPQILAIKSLDTNNGRADIVFSLSYTQNNQSGTVKQEYWFENVNGTWLLSGDGQIARITLFSETDNRQGANPGSSGPSLTAGVEAPTGTVTGATVTGGNIWNAATLPQGSTIVWQPMNVDQFILSSGVLNTLPLIGSVFTFAVTPVSGSVATYQAASTAYTSELISFTSPSNYSLAGANLGQPLQASWTLPTTYAVAQVNLMAQASTGPQNNPSTLTCKVGPTLPPNATLSTITIPATCGGQNVVSASLQVEAKGYDGQDSIAWLNFANTTGGGGGNGLTITTTSLPNGTVGSPYSANVGVTGGVSPYMWSVISGALPTCLSLNQSTGAITGNPTNSCAGGPFNFTVQVTDSTTPTALTATAQLSITINSAGSGFSITTTSLSPATAVTGAPYSANIQTNGGTTPIVWNVSNGSLPTGLQVMGSSGSSGTLSGTPMQTGSFTFTVTAQDSSQPPLTASQQFTLNVTAGSLQITNHALPGGVLNVPYNQQIYYSGGDAPVGFTYTGTLPPGLTLSSNGTLSGTPTQLGTDYTFTVNATDSSTPTPQTTQQTYTVAVASSACGSGNESILKGQYAFTLAGYNASGYLGEAGSFTADGNGNITGGEVDTNGVLGSQSASISAAASSYSVGSDNRGCVTIATSFGTFTTRFALGNFSSTTATEGRMMEWETGAGAYIATGHILQQTPAAFNNTVNGNFAFEQFGDGPFAAIGMISTVSGSNGGSITYGEVAVNSPGGSGSQTGMTGSYSQSDANGRFTMTTAWPSQSATQAVGYMVSGSHFLFLPTDAGNAAVGEMQQQTGTFDNTSFSAANVLYMSGIDGRGAGGEAVVGLLSPNGSTTAPNVAGTVYQNDAGTQKNANNFSCTYSVTSYGLVTLGTGCGSGSPVFYLTSANTGFLLATSSVEVGQFEPQVPPTGGFISPRTGDFFIGDLGVVNQGVNTGVGVLQMSAGSGTLIQDYTSSGNGQQADTTNSTGTLTMNADGTFTTNQNGLINAIAISGTKFVVIDSGGSTYPLIMVIQQ